jgi:hypothetical protein
VPLILGAAVEGGPLRVPVEGQAIFSFVCSPYIIEVLKLDIAGPVLVEEAEDDFVLGVRLRKQVLEDAPVGESDAPGAAAVCDQEEDAILVSLDLVLVE